MNIRVRDRRAYGGREVCMESEHTFRIFGSGCSVSHSRGMVGSARGGFSCTAKETVKVRSVSVLCHPLCGLDNVSSASITIAVNLNTLIYIYSLIYMHAYVHIYI